MPSHSPEIKQQRKRKQSMPATSLRSPTNDNKKRSGSVMQSAIKMNLRKRYEDNLRDMKEWKQPWPLDASNYKLDYVIGDGMFGLVWRGHVFDKTSKYNMWPVAIKISSFDKVTASQSK